MKPLTLTLLLILVQIAVRAQHMRETDRIYWTALEQYTTDLDSVYHTHNYTSPFNEKQIYLQKSDYVDSIPSQVNDYHIIVLTSANQKQIYQEHNNKLVHTVMFPVAVQDSTLQITFTPYRGELRKHHHYNLAVSDGTTIYFKYNSNEHRFLVYRVKNWGI